MRSLLLIVLFPAVCLAEPAVSYVEPASVCRGQRGKLTFVGERVDRPLGLWTSLPVEKLKVVTAVSSDPAKCELEVEVAADCPLGIYGLRLATEDGLSNLQLFVVDDIAVRPELAQPHKEFPVAVAKAFRPAEVDRYAIEVQAKQKLSFDVIASRLGTDADPLIEIFDANGRRVAERDNDPGIFFDCCFEHEFEQAGVYTVQVRDARHLGAPHWQYVLRMGTFPVVRVALPSAVKPGETAALKFPELNGESVNLGLPAEQPPGGFYYALRRANDNASNWVPVLAATNGNTVEVEPNDNLEQATLAATAPIFLHGNLAQPGDKDFFALDLKKGDRLFVRAETKSLNSAADVELIVVDPTGREIQRVDDAMLPGGALDEASLTFGADKDGKFSVVVREATGGSGAELSYRLEVQPAGPRIQVVAEHSAFTIPQNGYQSLPLTVTRTDYNGPIELALVGAPAEVKLEPAAIPEGANSVICKLSASGSAAQGLSSFSIAAKAQAGEATIQTMVITQPLVDKQLINIDLIRHALRDNQRWLPASVKNRLSLQITPPSPFNAEPAEALVILPRYQQAPLVVNTQRAAGFEAPITFHAVGGGQFGEEAEGRRQVFSRFPSSTGATAAITASFHSRSQANDATERIDISATSQHGSRSVTLVRSIMLQVKPAFELEIEPKQLIVAPGTTMKIKLLAKRLPSFSGAIKVSPTAFTGVTVPTALTIEESQSSIEFDFVVAADCQPRRDRLRFPSTGQVGVFQEEPRQPELDLEVKLPTPAK
jgi:hypothetical protein